jgi:hypothetical protein
MPLEQDPLVVDVTKLGNLCGDVLTLPLDRFPLIADFSVAIPSCVAGMTRLKSFHIPGNAIRFRDLWALHRRRPDIKLGISSAHEIMRRLRTVRLTSQRRS